MPEGDRLGGALAVHDPETGQTQVTRNVVQDESVFSLTARDGVVYGGDVDHRWSGHDATDP
ncbi:hypothetical protein [Actinomadura luteofluorescens]|uniref:hypothetical protein n=1 Tax=Actinomadura luteofluorescens TaxID=46163 RepID=UPI0030D54EDA